MKLTTEMPMEIPAANNNNRQAALQAGKNGAQPPFSSSLEDQQDKLKISENLEIQALPKDGHAGTEAQVLPEVGNLLPSMDGAVVDGAVVDDVAILVVTLDQSVATAFDVMAFDAMPDSGLTSGLGAGLRPALDARLHSVPDVVDASTLEAVVSPLVEDITITSATAVEIDAREVVFSNQGLLPGLDSLAESRLAEPRSIISQVRDPFTARSLLEASTSLATEGLASEGQSLQQIATSVSPADVVMARVKAGNEGTRLLSNISESVLYERIESGGMPDRASDLLNQVRAMSSQLSTNASATVLGVATELNAATSTALNASVDAGVLSDLRAGLPTSPLLSGHQLQTGNDLTGSKTILTMNSPLADSGWESEIGSRVRWLVNNDRQVAELRLKPPSLGVLEIRIVTEQDQAKVTFYAQNNNTRELMEGLLPRLRDSLASAGIVLGETEVSDQALGNHSHENQQNSTVEDRSGEEVNSGLMQNNLVLPVVRLTNGLVDTFI